jgi:hypothetical protein
MPAFAKEGHSDAITTISCLYAKLVVSQLEKQEPPT